MNFGVKYNLNNCRSDFEREFNKMLNLLIDLSLDGQRTVYFEEIEAYYENNHEELYKIFFHALKDGCVHSNNGEIGLKTKGGY